MALDTNKQVKYRYFFLSFAVAFLLLSLSLLALMWTVHPKLPAGLESAAAPQGASSYFPDREEALSVLFVGVSRDSTEAGTFLLAKFDPARGSVPIVAFPPNTAVINNGKTETLSEVYRYGGAGYTRSTLEKTLGITIDRYVRMDEAAFLAAASTVGTVEFDLPEEITLGQGSGALTLSPGVQLLDGQKVAGMIRYRGHNGGELERCSLISALTASIVNQRMDIALSTVVDKVFEKIINLIDTDISFTDYDNRKEAAAFLARMGQEPAVSIPVAGRYSEDGGLYHLADTFTALLTQTFS